MKFQSIFRLIFGIACIGLFNACGAIRVTEQRQPPANIKQPIPADNNEHWNATTAKEFLAISELKKKKPKPGIYETEGYVVDSVPECKCPPDTECDCPAASITISEQNQTPKSQKLNENELLIWITSDGFQHGRKYRFKIRIDALDYDDELLGEYFYVYYVAHKESVSDGPNTRYTTKKFLTVQEIGEIKPKPGIYKPEQFSVDRLDFFDANKQKLLVFVYFYGKKVWAVSTSDGRFDVTEGALKYIHFANGSRILFGNEHESEEFSRGLL